MARYPGAKWRPISTNYTRRNSTKNCVILHTSASATATSLHGWFSNKSANASSHFHVDDYGVVEQYIDTDHISWANGEGNPRSVTIETQGDGTKPWTAAAVKALVALIKWITDEHGIPVRQMASSAASQKGIGWHRLGVNGNFPKSGLMAGRTQRGGGQKWSTAYGKVCPGDGRIKQIPSIIKQVAGEVAPVGNVKPAPAPAKTSGKAWPDVAVKVTDKHTTESHNAWVALLAGDIGPSGKGFKDKNLTKNIQSWLKWLGFYGGKVDGDFGGWTVESLQEFLVSKGFLPSKAYVDRNRGPVTVRAEIEYLNSQRKFYA